MCVSGGVCAWRYQKLPVSTLLWVEARREAVGFWHFRDRLEFDEFLLVSGTHKYRLCRYARALLLLQSRLSVARRLLSFDEAIRLRHS